MREIKLKFCLTISIIFAVMFTPINVYAEENRIDKLNILFISSYHYNFISFDDQIRGIKEGLGNKANLKVEYMGIGLNENKENEDKFYNLLKYNLESYGKFDAIIAGDDRALEFCLEYRDDLFSNIPISFLGVQSDELINKTFEYDLVAGVKEVESIEDTIKFIERFQRNVDRIIFINYKSYELYEEITSKYNEFIYEYIDTSKLSVDELARKISKFGMRDAIISLYPTKFKYGEGLSYLGINEIISKSAPNTALYNVLSYSIGTGSIGGKVISHFNQGKKGAEIALGLLAGKEPRELNILDDSANEYIFDYSVLGKFEIGKNNVPKGSSFINDPLELFIEYKYIFIGISIGIIGLIFIIVALIGYISHKKKYEETIIRAMHEAEEANELKTYFISNISHELKTPVNVILSVIQLTEMASNKNNNTKNLKIIKDNCYRLIRLLNNIIDVEKTEMYDMKLRLNNINIVSLVEELVLSIVPYVEQKKLNIIFDTNEEDIIMAVDINKIERVILNLISNAIKFSNENGTIKVKLQFDEEILSIIIEDDGIGIENNDIDKIFDMFIKVDNTLYRKNEGSGIGLSIVKAFVELHKGTVFVCSQNGKGSKFTVEIPRVVIDENFDVKIDSERSNIIKNTSIELSDIYI